MKIENGLLILARQNPITEEEWYKLVEIRLGMIQEHFRHMSLGVVGDLEMVDDYFGTHDLKLDKPTVDSDDRLNLETRGIFPIERRGWGEVVSVDTEYHRDSSGCAIATTKRLWGLTRNGGWITIEVYITRSREPYKRPERTEEVARAKKVTLRKSSLVKVCMFSKRTPKQIWSRLGQVVKDWAEHRKRLYEQAKDLEEDVLHEEAVIEVLSR